MRYIFIFLLGFLFSCKTVSVPEGVAAKYAAKLPSTELATIKVKTYLNFDSVAQTYFRIGQTVINSQATNALGFPFTGKLNQRLRFRDLGDNRLQILAPINWEAEPEIAGISAGLMVAKSTVGMVIQLQGQSLTNYRIADLQLSNQWNDKPSVKVLGFPVQVGGMVDQLLIPKIPQLATTLKAQLNTYLVSNALERFIAKAISTPAGIEVDQLNLDIQNIQIKELGIEADLMLQSRLSFGKDLRGSIIQPRIKQLPNVGNTLNFAVNYSMREIRMMLANQLKMDSTAISLILSSNKEDFLCQVKAVGKPEMILLFRPILISDSSIGIQVRSISLAKLGLWKGLFASSIKQRIVRNIHTQRMHMEQLLTRMPMDFQGLHVANPRLSFEHIYYSDDSIRLLGKLTGDWTLRK
jgi:hypothetical protein